MSLKPGKQVHNYEVWVAGDQPIRGRVIVEHTTAQCRRLYAYSYSFEGRDHDYHIHSHDAFTREECLSFAKAMYEGKISRLHVDLSGIGMRW